MARMNESLRCCTKVGRWTAHQGFASFPRTPFVVDCAALLLPQRFRRLQSSCTPRGCRTRQQCDYKKYRASRRDHERIKRPNAIEHGGNDSPEDCKSSQTQDQTSRRQNQPAPYHKSKYIVLLRAQRNAQSDFKRAAHHLLRKRRIQTNRRRGPQAASGCGKHVSSAASKRWDAVDPTTSSSIVATAKIGKLRLSPAITERTGFMYARGSPETRKITACGDHEVVRSR